jgi:predicted nucleic acid-binding protein
MAVLLDTNILLRLLQPHHPHSPLAERALNILRKRNEVLNLTAQNLVEVWAAITRPVDENGLGFTTEQAAAEIDTLMRLFVLLPELPLLQEWRRLVAAYRVSGKNTHDARLVAAMIVHGVSNILTFNTKDFTRYPEIVVVDPKTLA